MSGVHQRIVTRTAFGPGAVILKVLQVDTVDGRGGVEVERVGFGLEGDVSPCPVDELVETHVPTLRALVAGCGGLAEIAGEVGVAVEGDGYFVCVGGICVFAVDIAFLRDKGTFGHHGSGVGHVINTI